MGAFLVIKCKILHFTVLVCSLMCYYSDDEYYRKWLTVQSNDSSRLKGYKGGSVGYYY